MAEQLFKPNNLDGEIKKDESNTNSYTCIAVLVILLTIILNIYYCVSYELLSTTSPTILMNNTLHSTSKTKIPYQLYPVSVLYLSTEHAINRFCLALQLQSGINPSWNINSVTYWSDVSNPIGNQTHLNIQIDYIQKWYGLRNYLNYLSKIHSKQELNQIIILVFDAFDVFFWFNQKQILFKYLSLNITEYVLFNSEYSCYPLRVIPAIHYLCNRAYDIYAKPRTNESIRHLKTYAAYLNSGAFIGTYDRIKYIVDKFFNILSSTPIQEPFYWNKDKTQFIDLLNDQGVLLTASLYYKNESNLSLFDTIKSDFNNEIFQTMAHDLFMDNIINQRVSIFNSQQYNLKLLNRLTQKLVYISHFNGWKNKLYHFIKYVWKNFKKNLTYVQNKNFSIKFGNMTVKYSDLCS